MLAHTTTPRPASPSHAAAMTELINLAGEGLPLHFWSLIAKPGEDPWQIGKDRAMRDSGSFSWRNAHVVEANGQVASLLVTYAIGDKPEPIDRSTIPSIFVPLQELENLALNTQYVNVLATRPDFRCRGFGQFCLSGA